MQVRDKVQAFISSKMVNQGVIFVGAGPVYMLNWAHLISFGPILLAFGHDRPFLCRKLGPKSLITLRRACARLVLVYSGLFIFREACWFARKQRRNFDGQTG